MIAQSDMGMVMETVTANNSTEIVVPEFRHIEEIPENATVYRHGNGMKFHAIGKDRGLFVELVDENLKKKAKDLKNRSDSWFTAGEIFGGLAVYAGLPAIFVSLCMFFAEQNFLIPMILFGVALSFFGATFLSFFKQAKLDAVHKATKQQSVIQRYKISENLLEAMSSFENGLKNEESRAFVLGLLRMKLDAGQSDEEVIAWMESVSGILRLRADYPLDFIPIDSADSVEIFKKFRQSRMWWMLGFGSRN